MGHCVLWRSESGWTGGVEYGSAIHSDRGLKQLWVKGVGSWGLGSLCWGRGSSLDPLKFLQSDEADPGVTMVSAGGNYRSSDITRIYSSYKGGPSRFAAPNGAAALFVIREVFVCRARVSHSLSMVAVRST